MEQLPRAIDNQKLLLHEQAVSDDGPRTAGSQEFGDRGQKMCEEDEQILHAGKG